MIPYEGQSFSALRRQCQQTGRLFEDPLFPAADQSLFYQSNRIGRVTWKRPKVSLGTLRSQPGSRRTLPPWGPGPAPGFCLLRGRVFSTWRQSLL